MMITHRHRLETTLAGQKPDRVPVALWRHFPVDDQTPEGLAAITTAFQKMYDLDLIKVSPPSSYCLKDWGVDDRWRGNPEGTREYTHYAVRNPEDWQKLPILDPQQGSLGGHLTCLRLLVKEFSPDTPIIQTIFSPMAQAKNLVGRDRLLVHLRRYPEAVHAGLEAITRSTIRHLEEVLKTGVDGIFYAVQHAQYGLLSESEFATFCRPYDLRVLEAAQSSWIRMAHLHGEDVMFDAVASYPVNILNWHDRSTSPSLAQAQQRFGGVLCGGLGVETVAIGEPQQVQAEALAAIQALDGIRLLLGTGCVMPVITPHANIVTARQSVEAAGS